MKEAIFILLVIALMFAFTAYKYRKQIRAIREFWRVAKEMRQVQMQGRREVEESKPAMSAKLVSCSKCGTWVPEERSIRLGRTSAFCSSKCLESTARPMSS
jgi:hypothetical protein